MQGSTGFKATAALLIVALAIGGAGLSFPLLQMLLELSAIGVAAYFLYAGQARLGGYARVALVLVAAILALVLLQLVPLPPFIWQAFPGREVPAQLDAIVGRSHWRPWTLDVEGTIRSLLVLIPSAVVFAGCLRLSTPERLRLVWLVVAFGLGNALIGIVQLATGGELTPYPSAHLGYPIGLFVNRNHNAALLLVSITLAGGLGAGQLARGRSSAPTVAAALAAIAVLAIVTIATTSRMALILLPVALAAALALLFLGQSLLRIALPSALAVAALGVVLLLEGGFSRTLTRLSSLHDSRFDYWTDVVWALHHYGIAGTGFGTFIPVYKSAESLGAVSAAILNHAHNDYVELVLEGGIAAAILLVLFFLFVGACGVSLARTKLTPERRAIAFAAGAAIGILLLFSLVDYPLRMPALSSVFALLCALILPRVHSRTQRQLVVVDGPAAIPLRRQRLNPTLAVGLLVLGTAGVVVIQAGISAHEMLAGADSAALRWAPWSTEAHENAATEDLIAGRNDAALEQALAAVALSPISAPAIRTIGLEQYGAGSVATGNRLMDLAAALGWRDPLTQVWAIEAANRSGETDKAMERADALFQQHMFGLVALAILHQPVSPSLQSAAVARLATRPEWRTAFLKSGRDLPATSLDGFEQLLLQLGRTRAPPTLEEGGWLVDRLIELGRIDDARRLWSAIHRDALLLNGDFERVDTASGGNMPADWSVSHEDIAAIDVARPSNGDDTRALRIYGTRGSAPIISQHLMLLPGSYELSFRAFESPAAGSLLRWVVRCLQSGAELSGEVTLTEQPGWQQFTLALTVPNQNCAVQRLALKRVGDIHPRELWIDDVVLKPGER
jgi:O-antigen ligase